MADANGGGCPVKHDKQGAKHAERTAGSGTGNANGCPVKHGDGAKHGGVAYNVYSQPIDPSNNMPMNPNQLPNPNQKRALPTARTMSTIPKGGDVDAGETWAYPSPQMFYNALHRKDKGGDVTEADVETIVAIHNNMNEKTLIVIDFLLRRLAMHCDSGKECFYILGSILQIFILQKFSRAIKSCQ